MPPKRNRRRSSGPGFPPSPSASQASGRQRTGSPNGRGRPPEGGGSTSCALPPTMPALAPLKDWAATSGGSPIG